MTKKLVVVTGGSGFIAVHIILQLLQQGYAVRTTVRSLEKSTLIKEMLKMAAKRNWMTYPSLPLISLMKNRGIKQSLALPM